MKVPFDTIDIIRFSYDLPNQVLLTCFVSLSDGTTVVWTTQPGTWVATQSPITFDSLYDGETYNATLEAGLEGWATAAYNASTWQSTRPAVGPAVNATLSWIAAPPTVEVGQLPAVALYESSPSSYVFDFGRNSAGVVRMALQPCPPGTAITLRHAEVAQHPPYGPVDGSLYYGNLRNAWATDMYVTRGDTQGEMYEPRMTVHGFRYAEVTGLPYAPALSDLTSVVVRSNVTAGGSVVFPSEAAILSKIQVCHCDLC